MPVFAQSCESTTTTIAERIRGQNLQGELTDQRFPEVAGDASFFQRLAGGWVFALIKVENGWSLRVYEHEPVDDAVDLSALTPPRMAPNPRDILGWHFRNSDNTGTNTGDVNAPQHQRAFVISPSLAGTGGYRSTDDATMMEPGPDDSIGWLTVLDYGLAGLDKDQRARMNYLQFDACITRKRSDAEIRALADSTHLDYDSQDIETFGSCGLDLERFELSAPFVPRSTGGDIDGDDALDEIAQIIHSRSQRRGLALCRAGTWISVVGAGGADMPGLSMGYLDQVEAWHWLSRKNNETAAWQGYALPDSAGDILILERIEKEAVALYWRNDGLHSQHIYHHVEP